MCFLKNQDALSYNDLDEQTNGCTNKYEHKLIPNCDIETSSKMEELIQRFFGAKFFSITDLVCGYSQIPLSKE